MINFYRWFPFHYQLIRFAVGDSFILISFIKKPHTVMVMHPTKVCSMSVAANFFVLWGKTKRKKKKKKKKKRQKDERRKKTKRKRKRAG